MVQIQFNQKYLSTNRGVIKICQIILGVVISAMMCSGRCFVDGRISFATSLNFILLVSNVVFLVLNLLNIRFRRLEQLYNVLAAVLCVIGVALFLWYIIALGNWNIWSILTMAAYTVIFVLFQWDFRSNRRSTDDHLPI